ncbi:sigma-70 family RNA polymerase sigma factor [soil metagenome]
MRPLTQELQAPALQLQQEPHDADDERLVRAVLDGQKEAFSELVARHQHALFRFAHGMGVPVETAQDLVQDTFVRAFTRLRQCRDPRRFRSWLVTILRNMIVDHFRDIRRTEVPLDRVGQSALSCPPAAVELRGLIADAVAALPDLLREAFLLRHHHGYSYDEVAGITGARTSAVKMRVHRAREQLRAALADDIDDRNSDVTTVTRHPSASQEQD